MDRKYPVLVVFLLLVVASGCSVSTDLGGVKVPNAKPDTDITGQPPTLLEAGFSVAFNWTGSDDDGRIKGYQWKISDNGFDGISARDTLTFDPLTGAEINPWHFTTATDTVFFVLADQRDYPGDSEIPGENNHRSFRSHTLFIRAIDELDAVDSSPAMISFNSTTLIPTIKVSFPGLLSNLQQPVIAPRKVNASWVGTDPDFGLRIPTKVRFLWRASELDDGTLITGEAEYNAHLEELISFDDPEWQPWIPYNGTNGERIASFDLDAPRFLLAMQCQDTAGAVSVGRGYQDEVGHFIIGNSIRPASLLMEETLGFTTSSVYESEISAGRPLNFRWSASAGGYNGNILTMQHGWDLVDSGDPYDPGWAVQPGLSPQNSIAEENSFQHGVHTFTLRVIDDSFNIKEQVWTLRVIPFVDYFNQRNLMYLDQYTDEGHNSWFNPITQRPDGRGVYRDQYWSFLYSPEAGIGVPPGDVYGFNYEEDWIDENSDLIGYSEFVRYKAVLCITYAPNDGSLVLREFKPVNRQDPFVWLIPYQERGGNFFLIGARSLENFLDGIRYMTPLIYDTREETRLFEGEAYTIGFGMKRLNDGTEVKRGPLQYGYAAAGIAAIDWMSHSSMNSYDRSEFLDEDRKSGCVGLKGLVLDPAFKSNHLIGPRVIADTIMTEPSIVWYDDHYPLENRWLDVDDMSYHRWDEFYNANLSTRNTAMPPQTGCVDGVNGECLEPMFRSLARFDWMRNEKRAAGNPDWPEIMVDGNGDLISWAVAADDTCGPYALNSFEGMANATAKTNNQIVGFLSYKLTESKPSRKADVYWGFDPYRFDQIETKKAVRWVLQYFGLQINN